MSVVHMRARAGVADDAEVVARLHDTARWPTWLVGCRSAEPHADGVRLAFGGPVPIACVLGVASRRDGVDLSLVSGDIVDVRGGVDVARGAVELAIVVELPVDVPTGLARELATRLPARWLRRLGTRAPRGIGPGDG